MMLFSKERTKTANKKRHRIRMCSWAFNRLIQLVLFLYFLIHAIKIASDINLLSLRYFLVSERAIHPLFQNRSDSESNKHQTKVFYYSTESYSLLASFYSHQSCTDFHPSTPLSSTHQIHHFSKYPTHDPHHHQSPTS